MEVLAEEKDESLVERVTATKPKPLLSTATNTNTTTAAVTFTTTTAAAAAAATSYDEAPAVTLGFDENNNNINNNNESVAASTSSPVDTTDGDGVEEVNTGDKTLLEVLRSIVLTVYLPSLLFGLADGIALPIVPLFARFLGCAETKVGLCSAASPAGKFLADVPAGELGSRMGLKWTMVIGLVGYGLASALAGLAGGFYSLFLALLVGGGFQACFTISRSAVMRSSVEGRHRGRAISLLGGINRITRAIGPIIGGYMSHHLGVAAALYMRALLAVTAATVVTLTMPTQHAAAGAGAKKGHHGDHKILHTLKAYWRLYATAGFVAFSFSLLRRIRTLVVPLAGDDMKLSHHDIGLAVTAGFAVDSMLFIPVGWAMDKYGRKSTGVPAMAILAGGIALSAGADTLTALVIASVIMGIGNGMSSGINMTMGTDLAPPPPRSSQFLGVWGLISDAGGMLGPILAGGIAEHAGLPLASTYTGAYGAVVALFFALQVKETFKRSAADKT